MKAEAGVTEHTINEHDLSGWARLGTGLIHSPEGRRIDQLTTLAHECGHNFLHGDGIGRWLPSHVMEYEAECYAELALIHHGMSMNFGRRQFGRRYVGTWVDKDRADGIPIDPRVTAFVAGHSDLRIPMRKTPEDWQHKYTNFSATELYAPSVVAWAQRIFEHFEAQNAVKASAAAANAADAQKVTDGEKALRQLRRYWLPLIAAVAYGRLLWGDGYLTNLPYMAMVGTLLAGRISLDLIDKRWPPRGTLAREPHPVLRTVVALAEGLGKAASGMSLMLTGRWVRDGRKGTWEVARTVAMLVGLPLLIVAFGGMEALAKPSDPARILALFVYAALSLGCLATTHIDRARDIRRRKKGCCALGVTHF